ncbi:putative ABC transporter, substrate-binding protein [Desulfonema limicola]|uniref:ABC transporter, substrate-binding protein n=1 Tax=Desulfonema limicola TaxID=45656 RepID=A0A975B8K0_9BACT|nr:ABC transporter substrate binding protein [Desulfonema limicola]QTA80838.1 putative ABC transporter, substrate-binding protein [Desulfonema limicola]
MLNLKSCRFVLIIVFCFSIISNITYAAGFKVLVVMSYEQDFPWCMEIKEGIDSVLGKTCDLKYFYMNTKTDYENGLEKAKEAYALYQEFQPDGVITADDNAQSMFVVPYLKDKVKTPVMFCAVNAAPEKYGYPASNVSGILERYHIDQSIAFAKQLIPSINSVGYISKDSPTGEAVSAQVKMESGNYLAKSLEVMLPATMKQAVEITKSLRDKCDLLLMTALQGIPDEAGNPLSQKEVIPVLVKTFGKPTISTSPHLLKYGILCAVVQSGQEHGSTAAKMLVEAMNKKPVSEIAVTRNREGKRIINVSVMKSLGIKPKAGVLRGAELVVTEQ